jgi:lipopolysaccharide/colanic/teichoic acid biosynthesis glycosyltransferase
MPDPVGPVHDLHHLRPEVLAESRQAVGAVEHRDDSRRIELAVRRRLRVQPCAAARPCGRLWDDPPQSRPIRYDRVAWVHWPTAHRSAPGAISRVELAASGDVVRRARDVAGSLLLLALTLPLLLLIACLIKLESPGPVLYRQPRVGLHGRVFNLLKFRSVRMDAEAGGPCWAAKRDPRVTRIGRLVRASRLDELSQLVNVLRGEMSLVGPRPERPYFVEHLAQIIPRYGERTRVLPGLTGWAQVNYPYGASVEDARTKLTYDLYYLCERSLLLDLWILIVTVRVVVFGIGAR